MNRTTDAAYAHLLRLVVACTGIAAIVCPSVALSHCLDRLKGKSYVNLPADLCPRYTDMLLGYTDKQQYGGVICEGPEGSYILLQRLLRQTPQRKAVWQIREIKSITKPNPQSLILGIGCRQQADTASTKPVFALVQPTSTHTYQILSAWAVNLVEESFVELAPQQVICRDPLLKPSNNSEI